MLHNIFLKFTLSTLLKRVHLRVVPDLVHASGFQEEVLRGLGRQRTVVFNELGVDTIVLDAAFVLPLHVIVTSVLGETPLLGLHNLLTARELELGATERLDGFVRVHVLGTNGQHDLTNADARGHTLGLTVRTTHTRLQAIRTGARQHLVDAQHVERVHAHAQVEPLLASLGHHVLVRRDAASFHRLGRDLFLFETVRRGKRLKITFVIVSHRASRTHVVAVAVVIVVIVVASTPRAVVGSRSCPIAFAFACAHKNLPHEVHARRERIDVVLLHARIVNANLRICEFERARARNAVSHPCVLGLSRTHRRRSFAREYVPGTPRQYRDFGYGLFLITR